MILFRFIRWRLGLWLSFEVDTSDKEQPSIFKVQMVKKRGDGEKTCRWWQKVQMVKKRFDYKASASEISPKKPSLFQNSEKNFLAKAFPLLLVFISFFCTKCNRKFFLEFWNRYFLSEILHSSVFTSSNLICKFFSDFWRPD